MSPKRAALPGKDALFGPLEPSRNAGSESQATPAEGAPAAERVLEPSLPASAAAVTVDPRAPAAAESRPSTSDRHLQLCVWVAPQVAHEVDRARARLLMEQGLKVTKSQIVEAILRPVLTDMDTLVRLLKQ